MIKEKDIYTLFDNQDFTYHKFSPSSQISIAQIKEVLTQIISKNIINAVVSEDEFSYKMGFLKKGKCVCLVISHAEEPKDYKKFVIAIKPEGNYLLAINEWYGESKLDKLENKQAKAKAKIHNTASNSNITAEELVGNLGRMAFAKGRSKKIDQRTEVEFRYYSDVVKAINTLYASLEVQ